MPCSLELRLLCLLQDRNVAPDLHTLDFCKGRNVVDVCSQKLPLIMRTHCLFNGSNIPGASPLVGKLGLKSLLVLA